MLPMLFGAFRPPKLDNVDLGAGHSKMPTSFWLSAPEKACDGSARCGLGGWKAPNSMGNISTAEVLRLRATSAASRDQSVKRSAQDDDSVGVLTKNNLSESALIGHRPRLAAPNRD